MFYKYLRRTESLPAFPAGARGEATAREAAFVAETARVYDRMGCDLLALDLVRNWEFVREERTGGAAKRRGRSGSLVPAMAEEERERGVGGWRDGLVAPPKAVWEEPDMSWAF